MNRKRKHIAIVEDDDSIRELLAENLKRIDDSDHARFPVVHGSIDNIVGVANDHAQSPVKTNVRLNTHPTLGKTVSCYVGSLLLY